MYRLLCQSVGVSINPSIICPICWAPITSQSTFCLRVPIMSVQAAAPLLPWANHHSPVGSLGTLLSMYFFKIYIQGVPWSIPNWSLWINCIKETQRCEFIKENKKVRKQELDQESDQEKKRVFLFFLVEFLFSWSLLGLVLFFFSWSLSWSSSCFVVFLLSCFLL